MHECKELIAACNRITWLILIHIGVASMREEPKFVRNISKEQRKKIRVKWPQSNRFDMQEVVRFMFAFFFLFGKPEPHAAFSNIDCDYSIFRACVLVHRHRHHHLRNCFSVDGSTMCGATDTYICNGAQVLQMEWYHHFINYSGSQFHLQIYFVNLKRTKKMNKKMHPHEMSRWYVCCEQRSEEKKNLQAAASRLFFLCLFWSVCGFEVGPCQVSPKISQTNRSHSNELICTSDAQRNKIL